MFKGIPQTRLIIYIMVLGLLPIAYACFSLMTSLNKVEELENRIQSVRHSAYQRDKKQAVNMSVKENFREADHFYIDKHLETVTLLQQETENLQRILNNKNFAGDEDIKRRLDFLTGPGNRILFSEGNVQSFAYFKEVTASLVHPVEVNIDNLKKILARVEGIEIGTYQQGQNRPQLIVLDFKLDKKSITEKNEVYSLNMKLLKREFL